MATEQTTFPTEPEQRIESLAMEGMRPEWLATLARIPGDGLKGEGFPRNVLGAIMHTPDTFGPFLEYWVTCKSKMALSVREQELVILRMGCLYRSNYVWKHHVPVAREFGVTDAELDAVRAGHAAALPTPREQALLALTDELVNARSISPAVWAERRAAITDQQVVDLIALVSQYVFFALMNNALQVQIEPALAHIPPLEG